MINNKPVFDIAGKESHYGCTLLSPIPISAHNAAELCNMAAGGGVAILLHRRLRPYVPPTAAEHEIDSRRIG
jgi:hypothetical protein